MADFILTIDSDTEEPNNLVAPPAEKDDLDPDFDFDFAGGDNGVLPGAWGGEDAVHQVGAKGVSIDDIIARRRSALKEHKRSTKAAAAGKAEGAAASDSDSGFSDVDSEADESDDDEATGGEGSGWGGIGASDNDDDEAADDESDDDPMKQTIVAVDEEDEDADELDDEEDESDEDDEEQAADSDDDDAVSVASTSSSTHETQAQKDRKEAFFSAAPETASTSTSPTSFSSMNLSRPLLRNITNLQFATPTPIQARAIPLALLGRDILGAAQTGSGKTAAFMIPVLERLLYREKGRNGKGAASRVLVLCPTRELAVQCEAVGKALSAGMDIRFALLVGGLSLSAQAQALKTLPDVLIATPGRLIDHIRNSQSFTLDALDILIIDEADRMLEAGFSDELNEIITSCPRGRQTMLFSATMGDSVDELVRLSLDKPVRLFVDSTRKTAKNLVQEFVRVRKEDMSDGGTRAALLLALCRRTVKDKCIVFFRSKALAHQMRIVFGLCGLGAAELHGNLTQEQRMQALTDFKDGKVQYLLATDLASRGLDIKGVETVINYDMPGQLAAYIHRIGRTARAGRKGRSITLVGEADRKMLKAAVKASPADQVRHRVIPPEAILKMAETLDELKGEIQEVLKEEKEEKAMRTAEMEIKKGENLIVHRDEIMSRPARTWFQTEREKKLAQDASKGAYVSGFDQPSEKGKEKEPTEKRKRDKYEGLSRKQKRSRMAKEEDALYEESTKAVDASIRSAKKALRPTKITEPEAKPLRQTKPKAARDGPAKKKIRIGKGAFDTEFGKRNEKAAGEGARAGRNDGVGLGGKGKGKAKGKTSGKGGKGGAGAGMKGGKGGGGKRR